MTEYADPVAGERTRGRLMAEYTRLLGMGLTTQQLTEMAAHADPGAITSDATPAAALAFYATLDPEEAQESAAEILAWHNTYGRANTPGQRLASRAMRSPGCERGDFNAGGASGSALPVLAQLMEMYAGWQEDHPGVDVPEVNVIRDALKSAHESAGKLDAAMTEHIARMTDASYARR